MSIFSILDYYPCGSYKLTESGRESRCKLYKNMSQSGVNKMRLDQLYSKGYIGSGANISDDVEKFINLGVDNRDIIILLFLILFFIIIT